MNVRPDHQGIHEAVLTRNILDVHQIIQLGGSLNTVDKYGSLPLISAIKLGSIDIAHALIEAGADVLVKDGVGDSAILHACLLGDTALIEHTFNAVGTKSQSLLCDADLDLIAHSIQANKVVPILVAYGIIFPDWSTSKYKQQ